MVNYDAVIKTVQDAGKILRKYFGKVEATRNKTGSAVDVVTNLDIEVEKFLEDKLKKYDPTIGFTGEELGRRGNSNKFAP